MEWKYTVRDYKKKSNKMKMDLKRKPTSFSEEIPAEIADTTRNDEILGKQCGYQADISVAILSCNYHGESVFRDVATGDTYEVKRSYRASKSMNVILTGERREHGKI